jgi:hypothetical protein
MTMPGRPTNHEPGRRMTPFRKTSEGLLVTTGGVRFISAVVALIGTLCLGALGAARFVIRAKDAPTRAEFLAHVERDSLLHVDQARHSAFTDSALTEIARTTHSTICFVYRNPKPFCNDQPSRAP